MVTAYVLLRVKPGLDRDILQNVRKLPQVKEAATVYGEYDLIMKTELEALDDLDTFIFDIIRRIPGVESSTTLIKTKIPNVS